jgi:foldase protein PrsA
LVINNISNNNSDSRSKRPGYLKYVLAGIAVVIVAVAALIFYFSNSNDYVAKAGNEKISTAEFNFFLKQQKDYMLAKAKAEDPNTDENTFWSTKIDGEPAIDIAKKNALESASELKVEVSKAKEQKITLEKTDLDAMDSIVDAIVAQNNNSRSEADKFFRDEYGVSINEFKEIYKSFILRSKFFQNEIAKLQVTEDDMKAYYEKNPDAFTDTYYRNSGEEAVWARHILINSTEDMSEEDRNKASEKAKEIAGRAKNGENFATLAKENSEDPGSASYGGDYIFGRGKMMKEFEDVAFTLEPGQVSEPVKTDYGYHIIMLEEKIEEGQPVSLRAAMEYREFGTALVQSLKYQEKLDEWKSDPKYSVVKNQEVYDSIG